MSWPRTNYTYESAYNLACVCSLFGGYFMLTGTEATAILELGIISLFIGGAWEYIFRKMPLGFRRSVSYVGFAILILGLLLCFLGEYLTGILFGGLIMYKFK